MKLESKFDLNDTVYTITRTSVPKTKTCTGCEGAGVIELKNGNKSGCPECHGRKIVLVPQPVQFNVQLVPLTIGLVRVQAKNLFQEGIFDNIGYYKEGLTEFETEYMCYETGIGSGTVWNEENLFATQEEAQAEADRLNKKEQESKHVKD